MRRIGRLKGGQRGGSNEGPTGDIGGGTCQGSAGSVGLTRRN